MRNTLLVATLAYVTVPLCATGQTVVDTFIVSTTTPQGWNPQAGWFYQANHSASDEFGFSFTAEATGALTELRAAVFRMGGFTNPIAEFRLYEGTADFPGAPANLLGNWTFVLQPRPAPSSPPFALDLGATTFVQQGQTYWLTVRGVTSDARWNWYGAGPFLAPDRPNAMLRSGSTEWDVGFGTGYSSGAFALSVPAPTTMIPLFSLLGLGYRRSRGSA